MTGLSDEEVVRDQHDLQMMQRPHLWPLVGMLPLKLRVPLTAAGMVLLGEKVERPYAVLSHLDDAYTVAEGTLMERTGPNRRVWPEDLVRLAQEGWVVD